MKDRARRQTGINFKYISTGQYSVSLYQKINEEPNGKPLGIFVGKEIYYTGDGSYPNSQPLNNITITGTFSAASSGV